MAHKVMKMKMDIHDFEITSIRTSGRNAFVLRLLDTQTLKSYVMEFSEVKRLCVEGFSLQNVIADVHVYHALSAEFGVRRACGMLDLDLAAAALALEKGSLVLIEAASGAEIACLLAGKDLPDPALEEGGVNSIK